MSIKLTEKQKDITALLGRANYNERKKKYERVLDDLNQIIVTYPDFLPAVTEKARILMIMNNWEESLGTTNRVLRKNSNDIDALRILVMYFLTRESKVTTISSRLNDLINAIDINEPKNHKLYYDISQLCARLSNRRKP
jgi:tetratricopeptide repeat protein 21B